MPILRDIYCRSHTLGGIVIRNWDNVAPTHWSHCGAIVDTRGAPFVVEAQAFKGVIVTPLFEFLAKYKAPLVVEYEVEDPKAGDDWVCMQVGRGYDYLSIFGRLFRKGWEDPDRWTCRELCEARLVAAGRRRFRPGAALITPNLGYMVL